MTMRIAVDNIEVLHDGKCRKVYAVCKVKGDDTVAEVATIGGGYDG